ncbi:auxin-induced in root cultures protein 12 [Prunus yedoensis var. nudiflora]|uniref:Auxin-induced in root cultures protein 12 n=1 Tax=Prunus yedoensis var. nudiflora TaxID=2094558 RepID=A0A314YY97_PRUYE|nr:auxin-induced in root cultures protein 12 [Prunus yedoensis var. nudiflora]
MASSLHTVLLVSVSWISLLALLISPAQAATCNSQTFKNKLYDNCSDLLVLGSYLHWTHNASNSSLSVAFVATPAKSDGWVAWAINPTGTKMPGAQTLLAYKTENGAPAVNTLNITSYNSIVPGKLAFDVWDVSAEFSNGSFTIFAAVKVPKDATSVNQVWQVGSVVNKTSGFPEKHDFAPANLKSFGTLSLGANSTTTTNSTTSTPAGTNSTTNSTGGGGSGALRIGSGGNMGLFSVSLLVLGALIAL